MVMLHKQEEESDGGDAGGVGGSGIDFHWDDPLQDIPLTPEQQRLLAEHTERQRQHVKDAKQEQQARQQQRENRGVYHQGQQGHGPGGSGAFKQHPVLGDKAQFSGMDPQETPVPSDFDNESNAEERSQVEARLELQHALTHDLQAAPRHTSTPRPRPV